MLKGRFFWLFIVLLLVFWGGYRLYSGKDVTAPGDGQERVVKEEKGLHDLTEGREIVDAELKIVNSQMSKVKEGTIKIQNSLSNTSSPLQTSLPAFIGLFDSLFF